MNTNIGDRITTKHLRVKRKLFCSWFASIVSNDLECVICMLNKWWEDVLACAICFLMAQLACFNTDLNALCLCYYCVYLCPAKIFLYSFSYSSHNIITSYLNTFKSISRYIDSIMWVVIFFSTDLVVCAPW